MSRIRILPEILSNKIAAGEVVERPASVVKELVENALDAGGRRIQVEIENGGRSLIRVTDDGCGMSRDDALLSIERYATSKLYQDADLFAIKTLGFRGEALPSIAAVSKFRLITRSAESDVGVEIRIEGGQIKKVADIGAPSGTQVIVRQLFFNTPARRKFLKTVTTEVGHVVETVDGMALARPAAHVKLSHNRRVIRRFSPVEDLKARVVAVLGSDVEKDDLCALKIQKQALKVNGWVSAPRISRSTSRRVYIYVNGRLVKDRVVQHALFEGYAGRLVKGQFPLAVVFLRVPHDQVDVNVHPAKHQIRFVHAKQVHDAVRDAVRSAVRRHEAAFWSSRFKPAHQAGPDNWHVSEPRIGGDFFREKTSDDRHPWNRSPAAAAQETKCNRAADRQTSLWPEPPCSDTRFIGHFQDTYLMFESDNGFLLVDQHAAHERIVYEKLQHRSAEAVRSQRLLMPESLEVGFREQEVLSTILPQLKELGFEIEPFGGDTYTIQAAPAILAQREIAPLITAMLETIIENASYRVLSKALDDCLKTMACHDSIRAHQRLSEKEALSLMASLEACRNPNHCPHGRPTRIRWSRAEIEKAFKRRV